MTFSKAKEEFSLRYFYWATLEFEKEIDEAFPNLGLFNAGSDREVLQIMRRLDRAGRLNLARGLLKRFHPDAVKALGQDTTNEEKSLVSQLDKFRNIETAKSMSPTGIKYVGKSKLRRMILSKFKSTFGSQCFDLNLAGLDPELDFKIKQCGWILETHFEFKGRHRQIHYWHDIVSPTVIEPYRAPAMILARFISINAWLGIMSQTQWESLTDYEVEPACDAAIKFCGRFFQAAPKLLKGLEFDKVTSE